MTTPFERMIETVKNHGYTDLQEINTPDGAHGFFFDDGQVIFYIGEPSGQEWYWKLDGKVAVDNSSVFNKWSQVPFYVYLPENQDEAERIVKAIEFMRTEEGKKISNEFGECHEMFGFERPDK